MIPFRSFRAVLLVWAACALPGDDDRFAGLSKAVTEFRLANGAQFFVVERPNSPLVAFHLRVKAGFADEPTGQSGVSLLALTNFIEGSELYGSRNPSQEKASLARRNSVTALLRPANRSSAPGKAHAAKTSTTALNERKGIMLQVY